jgi:hypothetical protein
MSELKLRPPTTIAKAPLIRTLMSELKLACGRQTCRLRHAGSDPQLHILEIGLGEIVNRRMARASGDDALDFVDWSDVASSTNHSAVKGGGSASKFEPARRGPILQKGVEETGMEDVSGAGGVRDMNIESRRVEKLRAVESEDAVVSESCGGEFVGESFLDDFERFGEIGFAGNQAGNVVAGDEVIDFGEQSVDFGIKLVKIGDDGDSRSTSPYGGLAGGRSVMSIHQKGPSGSDPVALQFGCLDGKTVVMAAENGALAVSVDEDEGLVAGAARRCEEMRFDSGAFEGGTMDLRGVVIAKFANVTGAEAPGLASDDCAGDFPTRKNAGGFEFDFGAARGKLSERDEGVGGVEADADYVNVRNFCFVRGGHWKRVVR